jgi:transcriptional regulatory protein GAL4
MLVHGIANAGGVQAPPAGSLDGTASHSASSEYPFGQTRTSPGAGIFAGLHPRSQSFPPAGVGADQKVDVGYLESPTASRSNLTDDVPPPLENLPAADDDFEWDERESSWNVTDPAAANSTSPGSDAEIPKITDGMATLTANDSNAGFLGSVSGSALLRLIWMGAGAGETTDTSNDRRRDLDQLFHQRSSEYPSASNWLSAQPMLTRAMVDTLIDAYFAWYHPTFPILHESSFREQYARLSGRVSRSTWHTLANLVAALGSFVSSPCSDETHATLFNAVKANLTIDSLETGSITLVQAFAMAANYLQKRNRPNSGYNYGGIALRLAISLGLHKEFRGWQTLPFKKEIRRRVWWSLCVLDVGATVTYGRPLNWPQVGVDIPFPSNIHEKVSFSFHHLLSIGMN